MHIKVYISSCSVFRNLTGVICVCVCLGRTVLLVEIMECPGRRYFSFFVLFGWHLGDICMWFYVCYVDFKKKKIKQKGFK